MTLSCIMLKNNQTKCTYLTVLTKIFNFFQNRGPYHIETSPLICSGNQWTGFFKIDNRHEKVKACV